MEPSESLHPLLAHTYPVTETRKYTVEGEKGYVSGPGRIPACEDSTRSPGSR